MNKKTKIKKKKTSPSARVLARRKRFDELARRAYATAPALCEVQGSKGYDGTVDWSLVFHPESERREAVLNTWPATEVAFTDPAALRKQAAWLLEAALWLEGHRLVSGGR